MTKEFNFGDHDWEHTTDARPLMDYKYTTFVCRLCGLEVDVNFNNEEKYFYISSDSTYNIEYCSCAERVVKENVE